MKTLKENLMTRAVLAIFAAVFFLSAPAHAFMVDVEGGAASCSDGIVVIDPGHGGEDTGAIGPGGVKEKDVALSLSLRLAELLKDRGCQVLLTRTTDVFVPLEERTTFANRHQADIFISVHANSAPSHRVRGVETYFLSFEATDDDARRVAALENRISASPEPASGEEPGTDTPPVFADVREILLDLASTEAHHESSALAEMVHTSMVDPAAETSRGVKQAPFVVLTGAAMPAVLVEVGFISNPSEEKKLASGPVQARIAESITKGVLGFTSVYGGSKDYIGMNDREFDGYVE